MKRRVLLVGWFAFLTFTVKGAAEQPPLKLIVSLSKQHLRLGEPFTLAVKLKNTSGQNISVFRYLRWGYAGGLTMHVLDQTGQTVEAVEYDDDLVVPSELGRSQSYLILRPQQFLQIERPDSSQNLFRKPGLYSLSVTYRSPVPERYAKTPHFWGREKGILRSRPVTIEVLRR